METDWLKRLDELQGRPPVVPLAVHFCALDAGVRVRDYTLSAATPADSVIRYYERYQPDAVVVSADTWVTAEAMGVPVSFAGDDIPPGGPAGGIIHSQADLDKIPPPDPHRLGRQPLMLEAVARVRAALPPEVPVVGCFDQSPFTLACQLAGLTEVLQQLLLNPRLVEALLVRCIDHGAAYAVAMAEAGADFLTTGDSAAVLAGPMLYERWALPAEQQMFARIRTRVDAPLSLHICGNTTQILPLMALSGADLIEIDSPVGLADAFRLLPPGIGVVGNVDPVGVMLRGDERAVREAVARTLETVRLAGRRRFVLGTGCTLAPGTPAANLRALIGATIHACP